MLPASVWWRFTICSKTQDFLISHSNEALFTKINQSFIINPHAIALPFRGLRRGICRVFVFLLFCGAAASCLAQIGVTYDSLLWQPDGGTGLYSDPNHWH